MTLNDYAKQVADANEKWWVDINTGLPKERNTGELLMLVVSELAEALEGHRKGLKDDHLPEFEMYDVELIDCLIRLLDTLAHRPVDIQEIFNAKMAYNATREDHKLENRKLQNGKKY